MLFLASVALLAMPTPALPWDLAPKFQSLLEEAGVPFYPNVTHVWGDRESGLKLMTADDVEVVRAWYLEHLPGWTQGVDKRGDWCMVEGSGATFADKTTRDHVCVRHDPDMAPLFRLPPELTTYIIVNFREGRIEVRRSTETTP